MMKNSRLATLLQDNPIVVTGMGCSSAAGSSVGQLWRAALEGRGTARLQPFVLGGKSVDLGCCRVDDLEQAGGEVQLMRRRDRCVKLAWVAAAQALEQAGYPAADCPPELGVIAGSSRGPLTKMEEALHRSALPKFPPSLAADATFAVITGALTQALGVRGPSSTVSATCASAGFAIAHAAEQILLGKTGLMLAGGADVAVHPAVLTQLHAAGVVGEHDAVAGSCRPFDVRRDGLVPGEGGAFLVLESLAHAQGRGATPLARLAGWGICVDESGRAGVSEGGRGLRDAMSLALEASGLAPADIDHVNAHGTGTLLNDPAEARAIREFFGAHAAALPVTSTKPVTGHCLGATPALEALICIEALRNQLVPPTANCRQVDPACAIDVVTGAPRPVPLRHVMSNSLGFWGCHASLIFAKYPH